MTIEYTNIYYPTLNSPFTLILNALAMNYSTTNADFKTLKNGVDERIAFIQHIETGYYNITKARNIVQAIKTAENEEDIIVSSSLKPAKYWFESIDFDGLDDFSEEDIIQQTITNQQSDEDTESVDSEDM